MELRDAFERIRSARLNRGQVRYINGELQATNLVKIDGGFPALHEKPRKVCSFAETYASRR